MNSRYYQASMQKAAMKKVLYGMLAELEDKPNDIGFPFNLLVRLVQYILDRLEGWVSSRAIAFEAWVKPKVEPLQDWFCSKKR